MILPILGPDAQPAVQRRPAAPTLNQVNAAVSNLNRGLALDDLRVELAVPLFCQARTIILTVERAGDALKLIRASIVEGSVSPDLPKFGRIALGFRSGLAKRR